MIRVGNEPRWQEHDAGEPFKTGRTADGREVLHQSASSHEKVVSQRAKLPILSSGQMPASSSSAIPGTSTRLSKEEIQALLREDPTEEELQHAFISALQHDDIDLAAEVVERCATPDMLNHNGAHFLTTVCGAGRADLAERLLERGAAVRVQQGPEISLTPLGGALIHMHAMEKLLPRLSRDDAGYTQEAYSQICLAHRFGLGGETTVAGHSFTLEGFYKYHALALLLLQAEPYYQELGEAFATGNDALLKEITDRLESDEDKQKLLDPEVGIKIQAALQQVLEGLENCLDHETQSVDTLMERLQAGSTVPLYINTVSSHGGHAWAVFLQPHPTIDGAFIIGRCNKGAGTIAANCGILIGTCDAEGAKEFITRIKAANQIAKSLDPNRDLSIGDKALQLLAHDGEPISGFTSYDKRLSQRQQNVGNCTVANLRSLELALLYIHLEPLLGADAAENVARAIFKSRSMDTRLQTLRDYLALHPDSGHEAFPPSYALLGQLLKKSVAKWKPSWETLKAGVNQVVTAWVQSRWIGATVEEKEQLLSIYESPLYGKWVIEGEASMREALAALPEEQEVVQLQSAINMAKQLGDEAFLELAEKLSHDRPLTQTARSALIHHCIPLGKSIAPLLQANDYSPFALTQFTATAIQHKQAAALRELIEIGANPNLSTPLLDAVKSGASECVEVLLEAGADPNCQTSHTSALEHAVIRGDMKSAFRLIEAGASIGSDRGLLSAAHNAGNTELATFLEHTGSRFLSGDRSKALGEALEKGDLGHVRELLQHGRPLFSEEQALLSHAVTTGDHELLVAALQSGISPQSLVNGKSLWNLVLNPRTKLSDGQRESLVPVLRNHGAKIVSSFDAANYLRWTIQQQHLGLFFLVAASNPFTLTNEDKTKLLLEAGRVGAVDFIEPILSLGIDINTESYGTSVLSEAVKNKHEGLVARLFDLGAKPNAWCLEAACQTEQLGLFDKILPLVDAETLNSVVSPLVQTAAEASDETYLQRLIDAGVDIKEHGKSALTGTLKKGNLALTEWLLARGVEITAGSTNWIQWIVEQRHSFALTRDLIQLVAAQGAQADMGPWWMAVERPELIDILQPITPDEAFAIENNPLLLNYFVAAGNVRVVQILLDKDVKPAADILFKALDAPADKQEELIQLLIAAGADTQTKNSQGQTPAESAESRGMVRAATLLLSKS